MTIQNLFIVESPSKIKKISSYLSSLGINAKVMASFGHIRDLDRKTLSIDVSNDFKPTYILVKKKNNVIQNLKTSSKKCLQSGGTIWLASDYDREGESIAWHLSKVLHLDKTKYKNQIKRIIFTEITKNALKIAIENPKQLDIHMFYSQQARRILDRLIGYLISPILWKQFHSSFQENKSLSAGRVQSIVVKLIKEREEQITNFSAEKIYKINGIFESNKIKATLDTTFQSSKNSKELLVHCKHASYKIISITNNKTSRNPSPPFITSSLQQQASIKYGFSPKKTMKIAQKLYENGLITYMRTDSLHLSHVALEQIKDTILQLYGEQYYRKKVYSKKIKNSQEAHEAIRPTIIKKKNISNIPQMNNDDNKLYKLIWKRTIASQMASAKVCIMTIKISISERKELFIAKSEKILFDGFLKVYSLSKEINDSNDTMNNNNDYQTLQSYKEKQMITYDTITASEKRTKPPYSYYSEASLIKQLEKIGVGRPSTYASIVTIVQDRNYVVKKSKKGEEIILKTYSIEHGKEDIFLSKDKCYLNTIKNKLFITEIGELITNFLQEHFDSIMNYQFTSNIETMLDKIAMNEKSWVDVVRYFYECFYPQTQQFSNTKNLEKDKHKRFLGKEPNTEKDVVVYIGKYGPVACIVDVNDSKKNKYAPLHHHKMEDITLEEALSLFTYPKTICQYKEHHVELCKGRYGLYLKCNGKNYSLKNCIHNEDELDIDKVKTIIENSGNKYVIKKINDDIVIRDGKYGPYIRYKNKTNIKIWGSKKPKDLTLEDCNKLIEKKMNAKK
mgnify:CR=1 FL=1|tara:strand:- start:425 stop:2794 length:2370 start_codon:yes stop_codon:yes gene_type:complete